MILLLFYYTHYKVNESLLFLLANWVIGLSLDVYKEELYLSASVLTFCSQSSFYTTLKSIAVTTVAEGTLKKWKEYSDAFLL